jgi:hypothetical protein
MPAAEPPLLVNWHSLLVVAVCEQLHRALEVGEEHGDLRPWM